MYSYDVCLLLKYPRLGAQIAIYKVYKILQFSNDK